MAPKKQKRVVSDSDSDSGPDDIEPPKKKVAAKSESKSGKSSSGPGPKLEAGEVAFELEKSKFVKVREWRGSVFIDIREYYTDKNDGELKPGKKGISLTATQYQKFKDLIPDIDEALKKF